MIAKMVPWIVLLLAVIWVLSSPAAHGDEVRGWIAGVFTFLQHAS